MQSPSCQHHSSWRWNRSQAKHVTEFTAGLNDPKSQWEYKDVEDINLIHFHNKIYVPKALHEQVLHWYHHYLCHPGGDRLAATLQQVCTWRGMVSQARKLCRECKACQKFTKRSTKYRYLAPKEAESLEPWHTLCVDQIGTYTVTAEVRQTDGFIEKCDLSLLCMTFIDPATGWFEIAEVLIIDQLSARISKLFDETWLARYPVLVKSSLIMDLNSRRSFSHYSRTLQLNPLALPSRIHNLMPSSNKTLEAC